MLRNMWFETSEHKANLLSLSCRHLAYVARIHGEEKSEHFVVRQAGAVTPPGCTPKMVIHVGNNRLSAYQRDFKKYK